ncbi:MAG: hypothetical protein U9P00_06700 [Pseudomonadota bacterium]|nr:hypothetical protein [Pseudomonadota bacterium]
MFDFIINPEAARIATRLGPIELACDEPSVPAHDGVGLRGISHIIEGFMTKAMSDFSECNPLRVSEPQRRLELSFEYPVFGGKILVTQKKFLVHCSSDICQYACPIHNHPHDQLH